MLTMPDSLFDLLDLGVRELTRLTSGLAAALGSGGNTRGDWTGLD